MKQTENVATAEPIENVIHQVERLYTALTGTAPPPPTAETTLTSEAEAIDATKQRVERLLALLSARLPVLTGATITPPVQVWEAGREVLLRFDIPGMETDTLVVELGNGRLTVRGRRATPHGNGNGEWRLVSSELPYTREFHRTLVVPPGITPEGLNASYVAGVLEVRLPRATESARRIPVQ